MSKRGFQRGNYHSAKKNNSDYTLEGESDQREAVREMEQTSEELVKMLNSTEEIGKDERALDYFERDIRELNQVNAMQRADSIVGRKESSSWFSELTNKVIVKEPVSETFEEDEALLSLVGGVPDSPMSEVSTDDGDFDPFVVKSLHPMPPRPSTGKRTSITRRYSSALINKRPSSRTSSLADGFRVVGSLTPSMLSGERNQPLGCLSSEGSFARKCSSFRNLNGPLSRNSLRQRDTSSTRVTGKIDYAALLGEQQFDLNSRRESMKGYNTMLTQVENYQKRMLDALDKQLVFMGIDPMVVGSENNIIPAAGKPISAAAPPRVKTLNTTLADTNFYAIA